jgi:quinoprotein glucose dehydrogenase
MPIVSMTGIALIIVVITAAGRDSLLTIGPLLVLFVLLHNLCGYLLGYWTGRLFRMEEHDCRTMAIEVGMQNGGLASGLAKEMGKMATVGLAPAIFGPLMNVTGSILASWWHRKPPKDRASNPGSSTSGSAKTSPAALAILLLTTSLLATGCHNPAPASMTTGANYPAYGGNRANNRYSPLDQITLANVKNLHVAWTYDAREPTPQRPKEIQCQPIVVGGILYGTTANLSLFALNAATGRRLWQFEPLKENQKFNTSRGVIYWEKGEDHRILYSAGSTLYAVDATTGKPVTTFGDKGKVDLHEGLGAGLHHDVKALSVTASTPGVICKDVLVIGSSVSEGGDAAPGHIRGFDVTTGRLLWTFHTIPQPGEFGYYTWPAGAYEKFGGANSWGGGSADEKRGVVYFGTGSPSSDFYGGDRTGANLFANCIVALDAATGRLKWYFQAIHHDLWDRDMPCPPNLVTVKHNGYSVDALVQTTKDGMVYVLDRDSGRSLFPIVERPVPTNGLPGEHPWPMQPYPLKPAPLSRQTLDTSFAISPIPGVPDSLAGIAAIVARKFIPPDTAATYLFGYSGGAEWGGNATTPDGILYQNANDDPWELRMVDRAARDKALAALSPGNALYIKTCSFCHGMDRKGSGHEFPELLNIGQRRNAAGIAGIIKTGSGRMPSFSWLTDTDRSLITAFLLGKETPARHHGQAPTAARISLPAAGSEHSSTSDTAHGPANTFPYLPKYVSKVWRRWADTAGHNKTSPPWGTLNAIDLNTGDYLWRVPFGEYPDLAKKGVPATGTESYGGPLVTAGDLLFIAATRDEKLRAFDRHTGAIVWEYQLPAGGFATPITYQAGGKQYVVIAAGGARGAKPGGWYIAFTL